MKLIHILMNCNFSFQRRQELTLPGEDSFDIFNTEATSVSQALVLPFTCPDSTQPHESNKENDAMGKLQLDFSRIDGTQNKDDLIGLCSGQFTGMWVKLLCCVIDGIKPPVDICSHYCYCTSYRAAYCFYVSTTLFVNQYFHVILNMNVT